MRAAVLGLIGAIALGGVSSASAGPLSNGDFSGGFTGWSGSTVDSFSLVSTPLDSAALDAQAADAGALFSLPGGGLAKLSNSFDFFELALFQTFDLPSNASTLSFDFEWMITCDDPLGACSTAVDPFGSADFFDIILVGSSTINLLGGIDVLQLSNSGSSTVDVSSLAGEAVRFELLLQDGDFNEADMLAAGNLVIGLAPGTAPEPATVSLLLLGLAGLAARERRRRRRS